MCQSPLPNRFLKIGTTTPVFVESLPFLSDMKLQKIAHVSWNGCDVHNLDPLSEVVCMLQMIVLGNVSR
jgi:hypothetical protein